MVPALGEKPQSDGKRKRNIKVFAGLQESLKPSAFKLGLLSFAVFGQQI